MDNCILDDLNELGAICRNCLLDLDDEQKPLIVQYIKLDDDIVSQYDNTKNSKFVQFAYNTIVTLLNNKYNCDYLSIFYSNKRLKLVYIVDDIKYTTELD